MDDRAISEIEVKVAKIEALKAALKKSGKADSDSLDERIQKAELEYEIAREEVELMSLEEGQRDSPTKRWTRVLSETTTSAASDFYNLIGDMKTSGLVPVVQALELSELESKVQLVFHDMADSPSYTTAVVAWAEDGLGVKMGDRILEVCGHPVSGLTQEKYADLLYATTPPHRIVFVRPTTKYQMLRSVAGKESASLRQELASVLHRLNLETQENKDLRKIVVRLKTKVEEQEKANRHLRHQLVSLQNGILFLCQMVGDRLSEWQVSDAEKKHMLSCWLPLLLSLFTPNRPELGETLFQPLQEGFLHFEHLNSCDFPWERLPLLCSDCQNVVGELQNWKMRSSPKNSDTGSVDSGTCDN